MSLEPAPKKRKKKVDRCPNPLFVKWLTEWRDEAKDQGKKTQYAYGKALSSLKKYPMPLTSGKEAKILDNFGEKICKMLDHKLEKHVEENEDWSSLGADDGPSMSSQAPSTSSAPYEDILAVPPPPDPDDFIGVGQQRKRRPSNRGPREYVPVYRSGPYALVLTLYRHYMIPASKRFMLKTELQREAQPLSEKSFTMPDPGSHYTAWSSMSTLISKRYVFKEGNPARYSITETGRELADRLEIVEANFGQQVCGTSPPIGGAQPPVNKSAVPAGQSKKRKEPGRPNKNLQKAAPPHTVTSVDTHGDIPQTAQDDKLTYWYIDDRGKQVISKDEAEVTVDDEISIGFLIKANEAALIKSGMRYKRDYSKPSAGSMVYAYLHNDDAVDYCPVPRLSSLPASSTSNLPTTCATNYSLSSLASSNATAPSKPKPKKKPQPSVVDVRTESRFTALSSIPASTTTSAGRSDSQNSNGSSSLYPSVSDRGNSGPGWSQNSRQDVDSQGSSSTSSVSNRTGGFPSPSSSHEGRTERTVDADEAPTSLYVLKPGTFDIVLCVDSCETSGGQVKTRKQLLLPELQRNGVTLDVRKLQVGDFLWIAREKRVPVPGMIQMPTSRELVLDYVVERKRMDDLCGSILDGRFKEQKFRLKQCGLRKPIYLIEDFGSIDHLSIPASTLRQATVNTQVVDGFFVKHTRDNKESVAYLTVMTRYLQGYYSNKTLEAYRRDDMVNLPSNPSLTNPTQRLMTFKEFNQSSVKNKNTTITETFAKQLLQFSGLTAEKALAITQRYKTPSDLVDAYRACAMEKDKEKLLANMKFGKLQRNMGPVLSRMVHMFYCSHGPLS
ncbi:crossover junction endonuclease MUS81-like [Asterias rubens]|uniref:crossover junction endonuclease MUS81-like n=1 Tax=Asterias rubens TaxID=7604 RepID=UPI001455034B|nr:crossover junction endonuclease MUS81-like [Asterias rubens]